MSWRLFFQLLILILLFWGIITHLIGKVYDSSMLSRALDPANKQEKTEPVYKSSDDASTA